jgi:flagellar motor switch protein FliN/FliY
MTDDLSKAPNPQLHPELQPWFDAWNTATQNVLSQVSGQPETFGLALEPIGAADSDLRYTVVAAGSVQGEMALRLSVASGIRLSRKFLGGIATSPEPPAGGAADPSLTITNDDKEALEELLRQIAGLVSTSIGSVVGGEVQLQLSLADAPWAATADAVASVCSRDETGAEIAIEIRLSPALATALADRAATSAPAPISQTAPAEEPAAPLSPGAAGYQRLFDVGLGVKLRFGTRRMLLRDVLALSTGLVVELENALDSPVDLLLDGRVIARGDVVVIDGKYGLRVTEVVETATANAARSH